MNYNSQDIELLSAYMDNELDSQQRQQVEARLAEEPEFAALLTQLQNHQRDLQASLWQIDDAPLSPELEHSLFGDPDADADANHDQAAKPGARIYAFPGSRRRSRLHPAALSGLAAALLVGVAVMFVPVSDTDTVEQLVYQLEQDPAFSRALDSMVAGETVSLDAGELTEVLAFRTKVTRQVCKHLKLKNDKFADVIFCQKDRSWTNAVADLRDHNATGYQPADGSISPVIDEFIESRIEGPVLTVEQERQLQQR